MYANTTTTISIATLILCLLIALLICNKILIKKATEKANKNDKLYVNYHLTRQCNYQCGFCFHTAKTSHVLSLDQAKTGIRLLHQYGMLLCIMLFVQFHIHIISVIFKHITGLKKINFAGGEPFLKKKFLGELLKYCKETLKIEITSVVTNGSVIHNNHRWFKKYGKYLDVFAISCDSFKDDINKQIGRFNKSKANQTEIVHNCANLCKEFNVDFKLNTVVNSFNWNENMVHHIQV